MAANVETMFYTRQKPWHGLGTMVMEASDSKTALNLAGLDWSVIQKELTTEDGIAVKGFKANLRDRDKQILGVVTDRYKVVQNEEAFYLQMNCWGKVCGTKQRGLYRTDGVHGFWQSCLSAILSAEMKLRRIWYL